jgi:hypothetical protein
MKISINNPDLTVAIDGVGFTGLDLSSVASNIHAIQFDSVTNIGHIEYNDGTATEDIASISTYQSIVDAHISKKADFDAVEQTNADEAETLQATYGWKREQEYPSKGDQLDSLYHADVFPSDMKALIKAVKDKFPK